MQLISSLLVLLCSCNLWDNLWSNNVVERIVFPNQFQLKISWNATAGNQSSINSTNYVITSLKVDGRSNRVMIQTNFSTLSLAPQEIVSFIIDFRELTLHLKQKDSCKFYELKLPGMVDLSTVGKNGEDDQNIGHEKQFPNIADLFDLWPFVMFYQ